MLNRYGFVSVEKPVYVDQKQKLEIVQSISINKVTMFSKPIYIYVTVSYNNRRGSVFCRMKISKISKISTFSRWKIDLSGIFILFS